MKHLIEEVARLGTEKEKLQSEMTREREALEGVLERLKVKHHKVVKEKKDILMDIQFGGGGLCKVLSFSQFCSKPEGGRGCSQVFLCNTPQ